MKRIIKIALCFALIFCFTFSVTAYAANETDASTTIKYTKSGSSETMSTPTASYEINIPSEISLNSGRELYITANSLNLNVGQSVIVSVDYAKTYTVDITTTDTGIIEDSYIKLMSTNGVDFAKVNINRHDYELNAGTAINAADSTVAVFEGNNLQPVKYGLIYLNLYRPTTIAAGTYTGTLYFTIELVNG